MKPNEYAKEWRLNNKDRIKEYNSSLYKKRRDVLRVREKKHKLLLHRGGKCVKCGIKVTEDNASIFDFHHIKGKEFNMAPFTRSYKDLLIESKKCIVLCSNCHRLTHKQLEDDLYINL